MQNSALLAPQEANEVLSVNHKSSLLNDAITYYPFKVHHGAFIAVDFLMVHDVVRFVNEVLLFETYLENCVDVVIMDVLVAYAMDFLGQHRISFHSVNSSVASLAITSVVAIFGRRKMVL